MRPIHAMRSCIVVTSATDSGRQQTMNTRKKISVLMLFLAAMCALQAYAQSYPVKPIRLIVPYPPGGGTDIVARLLGQKLPEQLGQQIIVDNRGGANAIIGTELAAKAAPDGYTMLFALPASIAVNPGLYHDLPYDPVRDFSPVIQLNTFPMLITAHPAVPASSAKDLIQSAKNSPGKLNFASSGNGSAPHLSMELFKSMAKIDITHIPYKGGGPALNDLLGGQVQVMSGTLMQALPFVKAKRLKALAVTSAQRSRMLPDVPAVAETVPGYDFSNWHGILLPKGTPPAIVDRLHAEMAKLLQTPDSREQFARQGAEPTGGTPTEFGAFIKSEIAKYRLVIKAAGVKQETSASAN
jgi:tripartite-type tricarboxylate transporter receptor subunit TctC